MMKSSSYLFIVFFVGISFIAVSTVGATFDAYLKKSGTPLKTEGVSGQQQLEAEEPDFVHPGIPGTVNEPGDNFQPRQPGVRIEPRTTLTPAGADMQKQKDLLGEQRGIGGVIPPEFD